jgi:hypothetical protein
MRNKDVEELFDLVRAGDVVELHGERTEEVAALFASTDDRKPGTAAVSAGGAEAESAADPEDHR